jgi:outer membrane protein TolC
LLPQLGLFVELTNHGAAGFVNMNPPLAEGGANVDPYFIGGMSSAFGQVFRRNFPDYRIGFSLNIPFRNRAAQSDYVHDQLTLRQSELAYRKQENQIRVDVQNALVGLKQARAQYDAAVKQRILEEQTLDAEQKKNRLGANTIFDVIQAQRDLAQSESNEVTAQSAYVKARVNLEVATGRILSAYNINIEEARQGKISRPPSALPAVEKP